MIDLEKGHPDRPGTWNEVYLANLEGVSAAVSCPKCGGSGNLLDHEIAADGKVSPSLVCPHGCGFHDYVRLLGWSP